MLLFLMLTVGAAPGLKSEILLHDGSRIRVQLAQDNIDVATRYGVLKIPVSDISSIEVGRHFPDGLAAKISSLITDLAAAEHKVRERATTELDQIGPLAYRPLKEALKDKSPEVASRASKIVTQLESRCTAEELSIPDHDTIQTSEMTVKGMIQGKIKVRSGILGQHELALHQVRGLTQAPTGTRTIEVNADGKWHSTGIMMERTAVKLTATGIVDLWPQGPGQYMTGPNGYSQVGQGSNFPAGALIGKTGVNGLPFLIGDKRDVPRFEGELFLQIVPSPWNVNSKGSYQVQVTQGIR